MGVGGGRGRPYIAYLRADAGRSPGRLFPAIALEAEMDPVCDIFNFGVRLRALAVAGNEALAGWRGSRIGEGSGSADAPRNKVTGPEDSRGGGHGRA